MAVIKTKPNKNKLFIPIVRISVVAILLLVSFQVIKLFDVPTKTEIVRYGIMEDKTNADGYLIRNENIINSPEDGVLSCNVKENERVSKDMKVATIFTGNVDEATQSKINGINDRIAELEVSSVQKNLSVADVSQLDSVITKRVSDIILSSYNKNTSKVCVYKDDINKLLERKSASQGQKIAGLSTLEQLKKEKSEIEGSISNKKSEIYTRIPGVFSSVIDGYESIFDIKNLQKITPEFLQELDKNIVKQSKTVSKGKPVVKILDNYEWYFAVNVDSYWLKDLKPQSEISLRFGSISDSVLTATVHSISEDQNGKSTVVIACDKYIDGIYEARKINADVIRQSYNGFKVSKSAIRVNQDGINGVYVVNDGIAKFKSVDTLYNNNEYVMIKEDNQVKNSLLLYDEIVVSGVNIEEGKNVKQ